MPSKRVRFDFQENLNRFVRCSYTSLVRLLDYKKSDISGANFDFPHEKITYRSNMGMEGLIEMQF